MMNALPRSPTGRTSKCCRCNGTVELLGLMTLGIGLLNVPGIVMSVIMGALLIVVVGAPLVTAQWGSGTEDRSRAVT